MCGIAGIVNLNEPAAIDPQIVRRMADAITHRGPDEDGFFFRPGLGMANRRPSIVGLKAEAIGGAKTVKVGASSLEDIAATKTVKTGQDYIVNAGANGVIEIANELTLKCGAASITLKSNGDISIKGVRYN